MFHFLKKKKIIIDCFVPETYSFANEWFPIQRASRFIPNWYKQVPKTNKVNIEDVFTKGIHENNVRGCPGIIGALTTGIVMPLWSDLILKLDGYEYGYRFSDNISKLEHHVANQAGDYFSNKIVLKIHSPWVISSSEPLTYVYTSYDYGLSSNKEYSIPYGINSSISRYNIINTNYFLVFDMSNTSQNILINAGTPQLQLVPLTDRAIEINTHVDTSLCRKFNNIAGSQITFSNKGIVHNKITKRQSRCPYSS